MSSCLNSLLQPFIQPIDSIYDLYEDILSYSYHMPFRLVHLIILLRLVLAMMYQKSGPLPAHVQIPAKRWPSFPSSLICLLALSDSIFCQWTLHQMPGWTRENFWKEKYAIYALNINLYIIHFPYNDHIGCLFIRPHLMCFALGTTSDSHPPLLCL